MSWFFPLIVATKPLVLFSWRPWQQAYLLWLFSVFVPAWGGLVNLVSFLGPNNRQDLPMPYVICNLILLSAPYSDVTHVSATVHCFSVRSGYSICSGCTSELIEGYTRYSCFTLDRRILAAVAMTDSGFKSSRLLHCISMECVLISCFYQRDPQSQGLVDPLSHWWFTSPSTWRRYGLHCRTSAAPSMKVIALH